MGRPAVLQQTEKEAWGGTALASRTYCLDASLTAISENAKPLLEELFRAGIAMPETVAQTEIVLIEVLNNIVEHGYSGRSGNIDVTWHLTDTEIQFETCDRGDPMPGLEPPSPDCPPNDVPLDDLPEGGFGWFMIRNLVKELTYQRCGNVNTLRFSISRG